jgi:hypothetical protein
MWGSAPSPTSSGAPGNSREKLIPRKAGCWKNPLMAMGALAIEAGADAPEVTRKAPALSGC